jgi:NADPH-dependent curcumin reductase CurA
MKGSGREVVLTNTPTGIPGRDNLALREVTVADPEQGEVLVRSQLWSVDPYQRVLMNPALSSNLATLNPGDPVAGGGLGVVVESRHPEFAEGDVVVHRSGWKELVTVDGGSLLKLDGDQAPLTTGLGVAGLPGFAAYIGMTRKIRPQSGELIFVSSAAGAVGSLAGQLARIAGATTIGSVGSADKLRWISQLGYDHGFDYHEESPEAALQRIAPTGIDGFYDNVGGAHLDAALDAMRDFGRIALCGAVSAYNGEHAPIRHTPRIFTKALSVTGFRQMDHLADFPAFRTEILPLVASGAIQYAEHIIEGTEGALDAFSVMYDERPLGKLLIRLDEAVTG